MVEILRFHECKEQIFLSGQRDGKRCRMIAALRYDRSSMERDNLLCDGKPQPGASRIGNARFVQPVELIEDCGELVRRDSCALILKRD